MPTDGLLDELATTGSLLTLAVYVSVALGVSFLCSVWEAVLLSVPVSHLQVQTDAGHRGSARLLAMRREVEQPIAAILTLNTIAHTVGAAGAGAEATLIFGSRWFGVISAVLTLAILILSEIVPKTLGATYCRQLAGFTGLSLSLIVVALKPVVAALELITRALRPKQREPFVTRAELDALVRMGTADGGIDEEEGLILRNLLRLDRVKVREVMTPRTILTLLPASATVGEVLDAEKPPTFSRIPVYGAGRDDVEGYVLRQDILERASAGHRDLTLHALSRPLRSIPLNASVDRALDRFIADKDHIALVVDEYGGTAGVLTLEDALETLLGREIVDESDTVADLAALARRRFEKHRRRIESLRALQAGTAPADPAGSSGP